MKLSIKALVNTAAIVWGGSVFLTGIANMIWPNYAVAFLALLDSIYPGYHHTGTISSVIIATLYAVVDAAIAAALFGWIYNKFATTKEKREDEEEE
jgi:hypothetical protein